MSIKNGLADRKFEKCLLHMPHDFNHINVQYLVEAAISRSAPAKHPGYQPPGVRFQGICRYHGFGVSPCSNLNFNMKIADPVVSSEYPQYIPVVHA